MNAWHTRLQEQLQREALALDEQIASVRAQISRTDSPLARRALMIKVQRLTSERTAALTALFCTQSAHNPRR